MRVINVVNKLYKITTIYYFKNIVLVWTGLELGPPTYYSEIL